MKKYSVRPATFKDLEAAYALIAAQNTRDYGEPMLTADDLRRSWQSSPFANTCLAYADGELEGYAELLEGSSPFIYLKDRNNIDLGFQLLNILEEIALEHKTKVLDTRVSAANPTLLELFLLNGYHTTLSFLLMEVFLSEPPLHAQWPEGICVRSYVPGQDERATFHADEEAAQDKGYHSALDFESWSRRMGLGLERFDPSLWFLACQGDEVAGVALNVLDKHSQTGWVDHLGVRRPWRNRGLGRALLLHTFAEFFRRTVHHIKLSVDSHSLTHAPHLYESLGMKTIHKYHIYKKELQM